MATPPDEIVTTVPTIQNSTTSSSLGDPGHFEFVGERRGIPWSLLRTELQFTTIPPRFGGPPVTLRDKKKPRTRRGQFDGMQGAWPTESARYPQIKRPWKRETLP